MGYRAGALIGGRGLQWLLRLLIRVVIWHFIFQIVGGFLGRYTHLPPVVNVIILIAVVIGVRFAVVQLRRRRA
ncbi:MAG: hypothetical protein J2P23_13850 [Microlunatus sp.]|nr:hypothetical protein [Microlunatus sp.]